MNKVPFQMVTRGASARALPKMPDKEVQVIVHQLSPSTLRLYGEEPTPLVTSEKVKASTAPSTSGNDNVNTDKSNESPPVKIKKKKKPCPKCPVYQQHIKSLKKGIQAIEEREKSLEKRVFICEGLCVSYLERENEMKNMVKKKFELESKLRILNKKSAELFPTYNREKLTLLKRRRALKKLYEETVKSNAEKDLAESKEIQDHTRYLKVIEESVPKLEEETKHYKELYPQLQRQLAEKKALLAAMPKPVENTPEGPCQICDNLIDQVRKAKKEYNKEKDLHNELASEIPEIFAQVYDDDARNKYLKLKLDYLKKRVYNQRIYKAPRFPDEDDYVADEDYENKYELDVKIIELMKKTGIRFQLNPILIPRIPLSRSMQRHLIELSERGEQYCCSVGSKYCKYLCGKAEPGEDETEKMEFKELREMYIKGEASRYKAHPWVWCDEWAKKYAIQVEEWRNEVGF